jgi:hypothetical protein
MAAENQSSPIFILLSFAIFASLRENLFFLSPRTPRNDHLGQNQKRVSHFHVFTLAIFASLRENLFFSLAKTQRTPRRD